jgi:small-conductance mechanosensitive channel
LSTTLLEIDIESASYEYTGKTLVIPNNQFVATTIKNMNFMRRFIAHSFAIVREHEHVNVFDAKAMMLEKAAEYCSPFIDVAQRYSGLIEKRLGGEITGPNPSVRITTTNLGKNQFTVTVFCPPDEAVAIEQRLIEDFMVFWYDAYRKAKNNVELAPSACSHPHRHGDEE